MYAPITRFAAASRRYSLLGLAAVVVAGLGLLWGWPGTPVVALAQDGKPAAVFTAEQKAAIEKIVKDYLITNPELFLEIQSALEAKMESVQSEKLKAAIAENAKDIYKREDVPVAGNPKGDITVVEFFDYNCGYCKRGFPHVAKMIEKDPKIRLVLMELPILSKASEEAARIVLAARKQGKYWEMHRAMFELKGQAGEATGLKVAEKLGLDMARLKKDMESAEVSGEITRVRELAQKMGINGTPHFLVGDRSIPGSPEDLYEQLVGNVTELRKTGCSVC